MEVSFDEYAGKKKDGSLNSQWSKKPATMIRKVAAVQALREAFPQSFAGMYVAEEMGAAEPEYAAGDVIDPQTQPAIEEKLMYSSLFLQCHSHRWMQLMTFSIRKHDRKEVIKAWR